MDTNVLGIIEVDQEGQVFFNGSEQPLGFGADARLPVVLGPDRRLAHETSDLFGRTIIVKDDHGTPLYAFSVKRRGHYLLEQDSVRYCEPDPETYDLDRLREILSTPVAVPA